MTEPRRRHRACAEAFGIDGEFHPRCCRFPKACSPYPYQEAIDAGNVKEEDLEPAPLPPSHGWEGRLEQLGQAREAAQAESIPDDWAEVFESRFGIPAWAAVQAWNEASDGHTAAQIRQRAQEIAAAATKRPDTETLRRVLLEHHPLVRSETGPLAGCRCGEVKLGQDVIAHVAEQVVAAMPPSPAEEAVKRVEALCNQQDDIARGLGAGFPSQLDVAQVRAALASPAPAAHAGERESRARQARSDYAAISRARDDIAEHRWDRYAQCDDTCTVDCGACKGAGRPAPQGEVGQLPPGFTVCHHTVAEGCKGHGDF